MINVYSTYLILLFLSTAVTLSIAVYIWRFFWRKKQVQSARAFAFLVFAVSVWAFGSALALKSSTPANTYFWEQFKYIGILLVPTTLFVFCLQWTGRDKNMSSLKYALMYVAPVLFIILIFTDPLHHLMWKEFHFVSFGPYMFDRVVHGFGWWLLWSYNVIFILGSIFLLGSAILNLRYNYRKQATILLVGILFPWATNFAFAFNISPLLVDITPSMFIVTCVIYLWGFSRFQMIDIIPVARATVFSGMKDPLFITDVKDRVVDMNKSALEMFGLKESEVIGQPVQDII
ncbi:MAG: PAS domain-containing protein, partial [Candidatus Aminicenantes bacterium]|nr:PAS domain-containing protein [Candidatus Aminicenantes bacterium]